MKTFSLNLEYVHIHVMYKVYQAEYGIRILVVSPQEYVNIDSTRRLASSPLLEFIFRDVALCIW